MGAHLTHGVVSLSVLIDVSLARRKNPSAFRHPQHICLGSRALGRNEGRLSENRVFRDTSDPRNELPFDMGHFPNVLTSPLHPVARLFPLSEPAQVDPSSAERITYNFCVSSCLHFFESFYLLRMASLVAVRDVRRGLFLVTQNAPFRDHENAST